MKVPIRYKSSDRYNAGVDVVYDDESKLEYAPFVYATTASGDNGGSEDEEGEDSMVVHINVDSTPVTLDKNWTEIKEAIESGTFVYLIDIGESNTTIKYIDSYEYVSSLELYVLSVKGLTDNEATLFTASSPTGVLTIE